MLRPGLCLALAAANLAGQESADLPRARAALKALAERHKDLDALRASYRQERSSALAKEPLVSTGTLLFRREPGCLVFQVSKPEPCVILLDERRYQVYRPEQKQLERFVLAAANERDELARLLMDSFRPDVARLEQRLRIVATTAKASRPEGQKDLLAIAMQPLDEKLQKAVARIELVIAEADGRLHAIGYDDPQGDHVAITIDAPELNVALDPALFAIDPPKGTTILEHDLNKRRPPGQPPRRG